MYTWTLWAGLAHATSPWDLRDPWAPDPPALAPRVAPTCTASDHETLVVVISGGVSLGSYLGGQVTVLGEYLKALCRAGRPVPQLVVVGASAGAINSVLLSASLGQDGLSPREPSTSLPWRTWIPVGLDEAPGPRQLSPGQGPEDALLQGQAIENTARWLLRELASTGSPQGWVSPVYMGIQVTRLVPGQDPLAPVVNESFAWALRAEGGFSVQGLQRDAGLGASSAGLVQPLEAAMASAAFPGALRARPQSCEDYARLGWWQGACPEGGQLYVDGGLYEGNPLRFADALQQQGVPTSPWVLASQRRVHTVVLDPDLSADLLERRCDQVRRHQPQGGAAELRAFAAMVATTFRHQAVADYSRDAADAWPELSRLCERSSPNGEYLGRFFGFADRSIRIWDYYAGMMDAMDWLDRELSAEEGLWVQPHRDRTGELWQAEQRRLRADPLLEELIVARARAELLARAAAQEASVGQLAAQRLARERAGWEGLAEAVDRLAWERGALYQETQVARLAEEALAAWTTEGTGLPAGVVSEDPDQLVHNLRVLTRLSLHRLIGQSLMATHCMKGRACAEVDPARIAADRYDLGWTLEELDRGIEDEPFLLMDLGGRGHAVQELRPMAHELARRAVSPDVLGEGDQPGTLTLADQLPMRPRLVRGYGPLLIAGQRLEGWVGLGMERQDKQLGRELSLRFRHSGGGDRVALTTGLGLEGGWRLDGGAVDLGLPLSFALTSPGPHRNLLGLGSTAHVELGLWGGPVWSPSGAPRARWPLDEGWGLQAGVEAGTLVLGLFRLRLTWAPPTDPADFGWWSTAAELRLPERNR
jgi:predicted acylesterase/phospholipase RssA